jgi:hypothetical protein
MMVGTGECMAQYFVTEPTKNLVTADLFSRISNSAAGLHRKDSNIILDLKLCSITGCVPACLHACLPAYLHMCPARERPLFDTS